jgi:dCTP deaminase
MQLCLADHQIRKLMESGEILSPNNDMSGVQPASLDTTVGLMAHQVMASFLPGAGSTVLDILDKHYINDLGLLASCVLQTGCTYVIELRESLRLPPSIGAIANPKSSIGRLGVHLRLLTDYCDRFDHVCAGYDGPLYAEVTPLAFPVALRHMDKLIQIRFMRAMQLGPELPDHHATPCDNNLTVDLTLSPPCYRAKTCTGVIDIDDKDHYNIADFWEPMYAPAGRLLLEPGRFYILASREIVDVPHHCAAELAPYDHTRGEYRVHLAGFADPGFKGRIVVEVCPDRIPFVVTHGQSLATLQYIPLAAKPDATYGPKIGSSYQGQDLRLSKHFLLA